MSSPVPRPTLLKRLTGSVPLLVTVIVHVVLLLIAGVFFVSETFVAKKKNFEAAPPSDNTQKKQIEHRLTVARRAGGSAAPSPVSAQRIVSTAESSLAMPALPELDQVGASSLGSMGFSGGAGAPGMGKGYSTSLGTGGSVGRGFMSLSFLGITSQRMQKVVFVVDISPKLLDIRKGGFEGFAIIREQMMKLVNQLPPAAEFGVVVFDDSSIVQFRNVLLPATVANKEAFFAWIKPINADPAKLGLQSLSSVERREWKARPLPDAGLNPDYIPPYWIRALRAALELGPETVYSIVGDDGRGVRNASEAEIAARKRAQEEFVKRLKSEGLDPDEVGKARRAALAQAARELKAINAKRKEQGKPPYVVVNTRRIFAADFQAELKRGGYSIKVDYTGWKDKKGAPIWDEDGSVASLTVVGYDLAHAHVARLQRALLTARANVNVFLFVGPAEQPENAMENLGQVAKRNGGRFQLLNTKRLKELTAGDKN